MPPVMREVGHNPGKQAHMKREVFIMYAKVNEIRIININGEHIGVKIIRTAEYPFYTLAVGADLWQSLESFYNINLPTARR